MNSVNQAGFSMVAIVMVLLAIGLLMMTSLNRQLSTQLRINNEERFYLKLSNEAASSLNWGLSQIWPRPTREWYCQKSASNQFIACIKALANSDNLLVKNGASVEKGADITLYYLASLDAITPGDDSDNAGFKLLKMPAGWLDFCPANESDC